MVKVQDLRDAGGKLCRVIELNRPDKLNCLTLEMLDTVLSALEDRGAERIILMGAGRAFCTGLDLNEVAALGDGREHLRRLTVIYKQLLTTRASTLALALGYAAGGGIGLMACAKTAVVADDIRFRLPGGNLARLAAVVVPICNLRAGGRTPGRRGWLGGELDAGEAKRLGLVDRVVSAGELGELIIQARKGKIAPDFFRPIALEKRVVMAALAELEEIAGSLPDL